MRLLQSGLTSASSSPCANAARLTVWFYDTCPCPSREPHPAARAARLMAGRKGQAHLVHPAGFGRLADSQPLLCYRELGQRQGIARYYRWERAEGRQDLQARESPGHGRKKNHDHLAGTGIHFLHRTGNQRSQKSRVTWACRRAGHSPGHKENRGAGARRSLGDRKNRPKRGKRVFIIRCEVGSFQDRASMRDRTHHRAIHG